MSNVGILLVSQTAEQALDYVKGDYDAAPTLLLTLDYSCALFWLAAFTTADELRVTPESAWVDSADAAEFSVYRATTEAAIDRLRSRKGAVLTALPKQVAGIYGGYYEQWIDLLRRHPGYVTLNPIEVTGLGDQAQAEALLRKSINVLAETPEAEMRATWQALDPKAVVMPFDVEFKYENAEATAILWRNILAGGDGEEWPPPPRDAELRVAAPSNVSFVKRLMDWLNSMASRWFGGG